jgi:steroid delta-isomerase-like uncharacterized protein
MSGENKATLRRFIEEVWNEGNLALADQLLSADYTHHDAATPDLGPGPESEKGRVNLYRTAFPDLRFTIENLFGEGDLSTCRWTCEGTHRGVLNGIAPTGKRIKISGITINRFAGGKIAEGWVNWDALGLLQQLEVVPRSFKAKGAGVS